MKIVDDHSLNIHTYHEHGTNNVQKYNTSCITHLESLFFVVMLHKELAFLLLT